MPTDISATPIRTFSYQAAAAMEAMRPLVWMSIVPCVLTLLLTRLLPGLSDAIELAGLF